MKKHHGWLAQRGMALVLVLALIMSGIPNVVFAEDAAQRQSASAVFTDPITQDGMEVWVGDGADDAVKREEQEGKSCWSVDPSTGVLFLYCNVDDGYMHGEGMYAEISVEYLDKGTGRFAIQFDETHTTEPVQLENSGEWKTHTFLVENRTFSNQLNHADFRIGLYATGMETSTEPVSFAGVKVVKKEKPVVQEATATFTDPITQNGMEVWVGDGADEAVKREEQEGKPCWSVDPSTGVLFLYCNVDDGYMHGEGMYAEISVEYLDKGTGRFAIQFDETHTTEPVQLENSGEWKTHTFLVENRTFSNQLNHADFRIGLYATGMETSTEPVSFAGVKVVKKEKPVVQEATATFTDPITQNGMEVWVGDGADDAVKREEQEGKSCWSVDPSTGVLFLYCDVDDGYMHGAGMYAEISVEYLDKGTGRFAIQFDETHTTEPVQLENSGEWKTHTFLVENGAFSNQLNHADFRIGLYAPGMETSDQTVSFASVTVRKSLVRTSVVSESDKTGFIFADGDPYDLEIVSENLSETEVTTSVSYKVRNYYGNVLLEDTVDITLQGNQTQKTLLPLSSVNAYGVYTLEVEIPYGSGEEHLVKRYPFSRILSSDTQQMELVGVGCHFAQGKGEPTKNLALAQQVGAQWVRDEVYWADAEKQKGQIDIPEHWDAWVNKAIEDGLKPILILDYSNDLYGKEIGSEEWLAGFCNYCREVTRHFSGRCVTFEVWNEWNGAMGLPHPLPVSEYCKVLIEASKVIKEENPDAFVIGGVTAGADVSWLKKMIEYPGVYESIDAVSMHPYTYPASPEDGGLAASVKKLNEAFGEKPAKEIWLTEIGWPTHIGNTGVSEHLAGAYAVRTYAWALANQDQVSKVFWYDLQNDGMNAALNEDNFGLIRSWYDDEIVPWAAKANYVALSAFTSKLADATFKKQCDFGDGIYAYQFTKPDDTSIIIMWNNSAVNNVTLNVGTNDVQLSDLFGNVQGVTAHNGIISVSVTDQPIYLEGAFVKDVTVAQEGFSLEFTEYHVVAGTEFPIRIFRNGAFQEMSGRYEVTLPDGFSASNTEFRAGSSQDEILIQVPDRTPTGSFRVVIRPESDGQRFGEFVVFPEVVDQCSVSINPQHVPGEDWNSWQVRAVIRNHASTAQMQGTVELLEPTAWVKNDTARLEFTIDANEEETFVFDVPHAPGQELYQVKLKVTPEGKAPIVVVKPVGFFGAMEVNKPITVDGELSPDEWDDTMSFTLGEQDFVSLGGPWDGVTAKGFAKWDDERLYLAVQVDDASHYQSGEGTDIWGGDSVQFCVDPGRSVKPGIIGFNEIGFAKNSVNDKVYSCKWLSATQNTELVGADFMVQHKNGTTVYEAAIPWQNLLPDPSKVSEDLDLGFSLLINNNDVNDQGESGRKGFLEYMSGIGIGKEPELFGDLVLVKAGEPDVPNPEPTKPDATHPDAPTVPNDTAHPETEQTTPISSDPSVPGGSHFSGPQTGDHDMAMLGIFFGVFILALAAVITLAAWGRRPKRKNK